MDNVIRPTFGKPANAEPDAVVPKAIEEFTPLRVYGTAVGHFVALIRAATGAGGPRFS
jgi:hypothetical protein